jgi:hypothetical protein
MNNHFNLGNRSNAARFCFSKPAFRAGTHLSRKTLGPKTTIENHHHMKKTIILLAFLIPAIAFAQSYSIQWYKIAGGGGTSASANGQYSVSGTIGQPDASTSMSGGNYSVTGGFWAIYAVQTAGAPLLTITPSGKNVIVTWPYPSSGYVLQQNSSVTTTNWTNSTFTITTNSSVNSVTIGVSSGNLFLRLKK